MGGGGGRVTPVHTGKQNSFFAFHWHLTCWLCHPPGWQLCMLRCITAVYLYYMLISTHTNSHTKFNRTHPLPSLKVEIPSFVMVSVVMLVEPLFC